VIGRKTVSKGREYIHIWIYVPTKVSEDTGFPFKAGEPCLVQLDPDRKYLQVKKITKEDAVHLGWRERGRMVG